MQKILTAEEMRDVDRLTTEKFGIPSSILMENAAHAAMRALVRELDDQIADREFVVVCGKGNNGGDGAALARILWARGAKCRVYLIGSVSETKGDARLNFEIIQKISSARETGSAFENRLVFEQTDVPRLLKILKTCKHEVLIDAIFGTGLTRPVEGDLNRLISKIAKYQKNGQFRFLLSLDVPSGLNADSSALTKTFVPADATVSFTRPKLANIMPPAVTKNGTVYVVNIGTPLEIVDESPSQLFVSDRFDALKFLSKTEFTDDSYKTKRGHAVLIAGSRKYPGAAVLSSNAAMVSGVGLTTVLTSKSANDAVAPRVLAEVMTRGCAETSDGALAIGAFSKISDFTAKADAVLIGSGISSENEETIELVRKLVAERTTPVVLDADGLNALAPFAIQGDNERPLILTPHEGEFVRLLGPKSKLPQEYRIEIVREFATKHGVILVLKGERVLIGAPDGRVVISPTGNSGVGKAGNGDTMAGIIVGFLAQAVRFEAEVFEAVVAAVYLAGLSANLADKRHGKRGMLASDVRERLRVAMYEVFEDEFR